MGFMKQRSPPGRIGQGGEIATLALFLATSDSSFIDGQLIRVDATLPARGGRKSVDIRGEVYKI